METFANIANTSGAFPVVVASNVSVGGAADGTPLVKSWVDQLWGVVQAILDHAGLTPDGVSEAPSTSQFVEAIQKMSAPPGSVMTWMGQEADPANAGVRALAMIGQGILRANYADLDTAIYCGDLLNGSADSCYRADNANGSGRNTAGVYLILPDMRGRFFRGLDVGGLRDRAVNREVGNYQLAASENHVHSQLFVAGGVPEFVLVRLLFTRDPTVSEYVGVMAYSLPGDPTYLYTLEPGDPSVVTGGTEATAEVTPYNTACHFWIVY